MNPDVTDTSTNQDTLAYVPFVFHGQFPVRWRDLPAPKFFGTKQEVYLQRGIVWSASTIGKLVIGIPKIDSLSTLAATQLKETLASDWKRTVRRSLSDVGMEGQGKLDIQIPIKFPAQLSRIVGGDQVDLQISGFRRITISGKTEFQEGEGAANIRQDKFPRLRMEQTSQFNIAGTIGTKIHISIDQDSERFSDLENSLRVRYDGDDDEIIQEIEAGNTTLSLPTTRFVQGGRQNKGLFGIKTKAKIGNLEITAIASQQKSSTQRKKYQGGTEVATKEIRDYEYLRRRFYFLDHAFRKQYSAAFRAYTDGAAEPTIPADSVASIIIDDVLIYTSRPSANTANLRNAGAQDGKAVFANLVDSLGNPRKELFIPPGSIRTGDDPNGAYSGLFLEVPRGEYSVDRANGYIDFGFFPRSAEETIAVILTYYERGNPAVLKTFPQQPASSDSGLVLKLIKMGTVNRGQWPEAKTWDYEWRHVYNLGARNLDRNDFTLKIVEFGDKYDRPGGTGDVTYIQLLKLDRIDDNGEPNPDNKVDINAYTVNTELGLLIFPFLDPFDTPLRGIEDANTVPTIYTSNNRQNLSNDSRYIIEATYRQSQSSIRLGFNILEGSEVIRLNGKQLSSPGDYNIDYFSGTITFTPLIAREVSTPEADLEIEYEVNPLFKPDQETLVGIRTDYRLGENAKIGSSFLFNSEKTIDQRVRIGEEPTRMTIMEGDISMKFSPDWLTRAIDWLPLIETETASSIQFEAEVARSFPNLNTKGVGYLDDFEGASNRTPLALFRRGWGFSSPPESVERDQRTKLNWFNPNRVAVTSIWTNREVDAENNQTDIFTIHHQPDLGGEAAPVELQWSGIQRAFSSGGEDLSRAQFIEVWMRASQKPFIPLGNQADVGWVPPNGSPVLHIDLGFISENAFLDGRGGAGGAARRFDTDDLNDEDRLIHVKENPDYSGFFQSGTLNFRGDDPIEDVGLDGCDNEEENGLGGCYSAPDPNYAGGDPNGDDFEFNLNDPEGTVADHKAKYRNVNGTQNNRRDGQLPRPDSEDLNNNGQVDRANNYYSYAIELNNSPYIVEGTVQPSQFILYRIPLKALDLPQVTIVGNSPSFSRIEFIRLWIDGAQDASVYIDLAGMDIVGNNWEERLLPGQEFVATVKNTQDNLDYSRPPTVPVEIDPVSGIERREQSLVLKFTNLQPQEEFLLERIFTRAKNLTDYEELQMYIHGPITPSFAPPANWVEVFVRLGLDSAVYYEVRIPMLMPGWNESNYIDVIFDSLTSLKLGNDGSISDQATITSPNQPIRVVGRERGTGETRTVGYPNLANIRYLALGIRNIGDTPVALDEEMEVWFDDLRLTRVRSQPGTAFRGLFSVALADIGSFRISGERRGIGFGSLNDARGSDKTTEDLSIALNRVRIDKLLPPSWGLNLPFGISWSQNSGVPRLKPGTDITLIKESDRRLERSRSSIFRSSASYSKSTKSRNMFLNLTVDRVALSANYSQRQSLNPRQVSFDSTHSVSYGGRFGYDLTPQARSTVRPLVWTSALMPEFISEFEFSYLPTSLQFNATSSFSSDSTFRISRIVSGDTTVTGNRTFTLNEVYKTGLSPTRSITTSYNLTFRRDLSREIDGSESVGELLGVLQDNIFRGNEISRRQGFSARWSPTWPKWFSHGYSYRNSYSDDSDPRTTGTLARGRRLYNVNNSLSLGVTRATLKFPRIIKWITGNQGSVRRPAKVDTSEIDSSGGFGINPWAGISWVLGEFGGRLGDISGRADWKKSFRGSRLDQSLRPGLKYQIFGYGWRPPLGESGQGPVSNNRIQEGYTLHFSSAVRLLKSVKVQGRYNWSRNYSYSSQDTTRQDKQTFPDLTLNLNGLEKWPFLSRWARQSGTQTVIKTTVSSSYRKKLLGVADSLSSGFRLENRTKTLAFRPLLAWTTTWKNKISTTFSSNLSYATTTRVRLGAEPSVQKERTWGGKFDARYELATSRGLRIPGWKRIRLKSNINITASFIMDGRRGVAVRKDAITSETTEVVQTDTWRWNFQPRVTYRFSRFFTGSATMEVGSRTDRKNRRVTKVRTVSMIGEFRFN